MKKNDTNLEKYEYDYYASKYISYGNDVEGYGPVYYKTTEDMDKMYNKLDFQDREVFTVMASGDHYLTSKFLGAKKVDCFDKNCLTLYYFYLRKWSIKYMNLLYPDIDDKRWIRELLRKVSSDIKTNSKCFSNEEKNALSYYWLHYNNHTDFNDLFYNIENQPPGKTKFHSASDVAKYVNGDIKFSQLDMFSENQFKDKYDVACISNILDWARGDKNKISIFRDNLNKLLRRDGIILCSRLNYQSKDSLRIEREIFDSNFDIVGKNFNSSYAYVKR